MTTALIGADGAAERTRFAVVRSRPRPVEADILGSAMALAVAGEGTQQFLVAQFPDRAVAIAADLTTVGVSDLPRVLQGSNTTRFEDDSVDRIVLRLCGFDPDSPVTEVRAGDEQGPGMWPSRELTPVGDALAKRHVIMKLDAPRRTRVDRARRARENGRVAALTVFGHGSWLPHDDPQCRGWLEEEFDLVELRLSARTTAIQRVMFSSALPGWRRNNGWIQNRATGRWAAGGKVIGRVVREMRHLVTSPQPVGYASTETSWTLVGHLTIDAGLEAITLAGMSRRILLEGASCARLAEALAADTVLGALTDQD